MLRRSFSGSTIVAVISGLVGLAIAIANVFTPRDIGAVGAIIAAWGAVVWVTAAFERHTVATTRAFTLGRESTRIRPVGDLPD